MIFDALKAIVFAGIPVGVCSFLMVYYAYYKGYLSRDVEIRHAFKNKDDDKSLLAKKHKKKLLFLHSKWVAFGGGFYGLIAMLTFVVIELLQIVNFLLSVTSWKDITALFSIKAFIAMFIDSIMNMLKAAVWFIYWPNKISSGNFLIWILIAYLGYRLGAMFAKKYAIAKEYATAQQAK